MSALGANSKYQDLVIEMRCFKRLTNNYIEDVKLNGKCIRPISDGKAVIKSIKF